MYESVSNSVVPNSLRCHGLSMGFSRQEYWSGLLFPSPGIFLTQGSNPGLLHCRQILNHMSYQGMLIIGLLTRQMNILLSKISSWSEKLIVFGIFKRTRHLMLGLSCSSNGKEPACDAEDQGLISGLGSSSGEGNGNPLKYSCLKNLMDREAWWATVYGVAKNWTRLSDLTHTHRHLKRILSCFLKDLWFWFRKDSGADSVLRILV